MNTFEIITQNYLYKEVNKNNICKHQWIYYKQKNHNLFSKVSGFEIY